MQSTAGDMLVADHEETEDVYVVALREAMERQAQENPVAPADESDDLTPVVKRRNLFEAYKAWVRQFPLGVRVLVHLSTLTALVAILVFCVLPILVGLLATAFAALVSLGVIFVVLLINSLFNG